MVSFPNEGPTPFRFDHNAFQASVVPSFLGNAVPSFNPASCRRCGTVGCDVKVLDCGCLFHARCISLKANQPLTTCPACHSSVRSLYLMPMDFSEIDQAKEAAAAMAPSSKRGKKRKNATIARLNPTTIGTSGEGESGDGSDLRTGRWTTEETLFCDKLIEHYEQGELPVMEGTKLNDFLANMLKSKQSRLTKKMKNAKLSAKAYKHNGPGYIVDDESAKNFSQLELAFYESIQCDMERAEIRFHMQKEWRELFSSYCVSMGQKLDADAWLSSVEELDRRVSQAKDAARMARRKVMMGYALSQDSLNPERGVFIEKFISTDDTTGNDIMSPGHSTFQGIGSGIGTSSSLSNANATVKRQRTGHERSLKEFSSPFVGKVIQYIQRHQLPFEHIDAWVPSFVSQSSSGEDDIVGVGNPSPNGGGAEQKCRLCFAGFATTDAQIPADGSGPVPMSSQDQFDLLSFGEYSSKFSFDVGCGLPGRVYSSGICSWEQGVENAPSHQFERCGGAAQWGIKTVLGVPIPSPNVGRVVVLLYSRHDRNRDLEMVRRVTEELTKLMPTPKWKLVVDVGSTPPMPDDGIASDKRTQEVLKLLAEHTPTHRNSPYSPYLPGFTSLRLLLLKRNRTSEEDDLLTTMLDSYSSYLSSGRSSSDAAWMIARDYMQLTQPANQQCALMPLSQHSIQQQQQLALQQQQQQQQQQQMQAQQQVQQQLQAQQQAAQQQSSHQRLQTLQSQVGHIHHGGSHQQNIGATVASINQLNQAPNGLQNSFQQQQQQLQHLEALQQQVAEIQRRASGAFQLQQKQDLSVQLSNAGSTPNAGNNFLNIGPHASQGALSSLGHVAPQSTQNVPNGIAALSQVAQHHQHTAFQSLGHSGLGMQPQDKNGVQGA